ncbi:hypothetical protein ACHAW6_001056, partial [Cyclotella cf. meneghiniana]
FTFNEWEVIDNSWGEATHDPALLPDPPSATATTNDDTATPAQGPPTPPDDPTVLLLADADNGFGNLSRYSMLWEVRHWWPAGSRFAFNLYRHECHLILCGAPGSTPALLFIRDGVLQGCFLHSVYAGQVSCLATEWQYLCRIVPNIGPLLAPIEDTLRTKFLPAILGPDIKIDDDLRNLLALGVKSRGLAIRNPSLTAESLFCTSQAATAYLSGSLLRNKPISTHHHRATVRSAGASSRKEHHDGDTAFLQAILECSLPKVKKCLEQAGATGAWISMIPDRFMGTELKKTEWLDNIAL